MKTSPFEYLRRGNWTIFFYFEASGGIDRGGVGKLFSENLSSPGVERRGKYGSSFRVERANFPRFIIVSKRLAKRVVKGLVSNQPSQPSVPSVRSNLAVRHI